MLTNEEIRALLNDLENDRVERTISTTNTDKFGQAICAFANDLPNNQKPGYLFLGVNDDGSIHPSNGPIQFYQYDDRIEILNHGGLYGRATIDNFPYVNDYRNLVIAEAMKVLGYVNRQSRGVFRVQEDLKENENGEPQYDFSFGTAVMVVEHKSAIPDRLIQSAIEQGLISSESDIEILKMSKNDEQKPPQMGENDEGKSSKTPKMGENDEGKSSKTLKMGEKVHFPTLAIKSILELIRQNPTIKYAQIEDNLGIDENTVHRSIAWLKENGYINKEHSKVKGVWQLI